MAGIFICGRQLSPRRHGDTEKTGRVNLPIFPFGRLQSASNERASRKFPGAVL
jgi:hypothetical protein